MRILAAIALGALFGFSPLAWSGSGLAEAQTAKAQPATPQYRIMGGFEAREGAWPWQVSLFFRTPNDLFIPGCGGTLIDARWVLSAAHCFRDYGTSDVVVVSGTHRIERPLRLGGGPGRQIRVSRIISHEQFGQERLHNDIALLKLAAPAAALPTSLASPADRTIEKAGRTATVIGWGLLQPLREEEGVLIDYHTDEPVPFGDPDYYPDQLMQVHVPLVDLDICREAYSDLLVAGNVLDERVLCAGRAAGGKDSCQGDSGGPLLTRRTGGEYVQVGIVSRGDGCGLPNRYGIYTRVAAYADWIEEQTGIDLMPPAPPAPPVAGRPEPEAPAAEPEPDAPAMEPRPDEPDLAEEPADDTPGQLPEDPRPVVEDLLSGDNPADLDVEFVEGQVLNIGQRAHFKVTTDKPGYLALIDITPDGKITQIFPNERSLTTPLGKRERSNYVERDRPLLVPDPRNPYEGFEFIVDPPVGEGLLVAVLSEEPMRSIPLPEMPTQIASMPEIVDYLVSLAEELSRNLIVEGRPRPRDWSVTMARYRIEP